MKTITKAIKILALVLMMSIVNKSWGQCAASFTFTQGSNGTIFLTSTSAITNSNTTYGWTISPCCTSTIVGNGTTSPTITVPSNGTYTVFLFINSAISPTCSSNTASLVNVSSICNLNASFIYSTNYGGGNVFFTNTSTSTGTNTVYNWNYGNGITSTTSLQSQALINYTVGGLYTVTLTATNNGTCSSTFTTNVTPCMTTPDFTYSIGPNGNVTFTNLTTGTVSGATYTWNFPGASNINLNNSINPPTITYTANGFYTTTLYVGGSSCFAAKDLTYFVNNICTLNANINHTFNGGGSVYFYDNSTGTSTNTTYNWNFGNGITSTLTNPSITYTTGGNYTVTLTATDNGTCSSTYTTIINPCMLSSNFTYSTGANGIVSFNNVSTNTIVGTSYFWNFGNGITSTLAMPPSITYTANGNYIVYFGSSNGGVPTCSSNASSQTITINNICNLIANTNYTLLSNGQAFFQNTSTGTNTNTTYFWNFGNGNTSTVSNFPSTTYTASGIYIATLTANNNTLLSCISTKTVLINVGCNLNANFSASQSTTGVFSFNNSSSGTNTTTTYSWAFGNSNINAATSPTTIYNVPGAYVVTLTATNFNPYCISTKTVLINVACNLNSNFTYTIGANGLVNFNSTSLGTNALTHYRWTFGDGNVNNGQNNVNVSNTYLSNGTYFVTLKDSTNNPVCTSQITKTVVVSNITIPCNLNAGFNFVQNGNGSVSFTNTSAGTSTNTSYIWSFGNGNNATTAFASTTYTANGTYIISLTANNNTTPTCISNYSQVIIINSICNLTANFSHTVGSNGLVNFNSASIGSSTNSIYNWNYGDGTTGTGNPASHIYASSGAHSVLLSILDTTTIYYCTDTLVQSINVTGIPCLANANFTLSPTQTPQYWTATPAYPWNVANATWTWGDGSSSNGLYSSHTYTAAATYSVCLTVTATCGSTATTCTSQYISKTSSSAASAIIQINVIRPALTPVSITKQVLQTSDVFVYPNPSGGEININVKNILNSSVFINVYNIVGAVVYHTLAETINTEIQKEINLSELSNGIYFVKVNSNNQEVTKKIIINK
jgi:PKD repeat protein